MHILTMRGSLEDQEEELDHAAYRATQQQHQGLVGSALDELTTSNDIDGNISETDDFFVGHKITLIAPVSVTAIVLLVGIAYVCANRKYRLNWFQKNVLLAERDRHERQQHSQSIGGGGASLIALEGSAVTESTSGAAVQDVNRSGDEADATTRLLIHQKTPEVVASGMGVSSGSWRSMVGTNSNHRTVATESGSTTGLLGSIFQRSQGQGQGQGKCDVPEQRHQRQWYNGGSDSVTTITVNYVSLRRCDRQQSSCDSVPSSPTSVTTTDHSGGLKANSLSCQNAGSATKDTVVKPIDERHTVVTGSGSDRSNLLERR